MSSILSSWKERARQLGAEIYALYLAYKDPRVSLPARIFAACVVAYAFSPIDLIPDFIPVLGYLDDLVLIPQGIVVARKLIPPVVLGGVPCRGFGGDEAGQACEQNGCRGDNRRLADTGRAVGLPDCTVFPGVSPEM